MHGALHRVGAVCAAGLICGVELVRCPIDACENVVESEFLT